MDKTPAQQLRPLLMNEHWVLMEEHLAVEKQKLVNQICNCNETELKLLQGQIKMIDQMLKLKENMKAEMRS